MGFADTLSQMFGDYPQSSSQIDRGRVQQMTQLQSEYNNARMDPNSGIGLTPEAQALQEQQLGNDVRGQMSGSGAGMSSASNDQVRKAIVDYRIAQMGKHQQYMDSLRTGMLQASQPQAMQPGLGRQMLSSFAGRAGQGAANDLFGFGSNNPSGMDRNGQPGGGSYPGNPDNGQRQGGMNVNISSGT